MAVRLGKLFGNGLGLWLWMQNAHELWHANRELADKVKAIPVLKMRNPSRVPKVRKAAKMAARFNDRAD